MAKPTWVTLDKSSGTGGGSVKVTASRNSTTSERSGSLTVKTASGLTKSVSISQEKVPTRTFTYDPPTTTLYSAAAATVLVDVWMNPYIQYPLESGSVTLSIDDNTGFNYIDMRGCRFRTRNQDEDYGAWKTYVSSGGAGVTLTFEPQPGEVFTGFQMELHCPAFAGSGASETYHFYASFYWSDGYTTPSMDWYYNHYNPN